MDQSAIAINAMHSTCRFQRAPQVQKPQTFLHCQPTCVCMAPKQPDTVPDHKTTVISRRASVYTVKRMKDACHSGPI